MKIGVTKSRAAVIVLLSIAGLAVPQSEAQETKQIFVRRLNTPPTLKLEDIRGAHDVMMLKSASAVKRLVDKLGVKEEAKAEWETDKIEAMIAHAKKLVDKEEGKTKKEAKALMAGVDFSEEMIVLVRWQTGGPLYGTLNYEVKGDGLNFFVLAPDPEILWKLRRGVRGKALFNGADFFVIPRDVSVTIEPQERPWPR